MNRCPDVSEITIKRALKSLVDHNEIRMYDIESEQESANPRRPTQNELRQQFFACYDIHTHILYISDSEKKGVLAKYFKGVYNQNVKIRERFASFEDFERTVRYINTVGTGKEIHLITVREDGTYIQSRVMQHYSSIIHHELGNKAFDFHTLRHTHATELEEAGVAMKEIQRRLGHKSEMTTRRVYVHHTDEMRMQSVEIINTMYK